MNQQCRVCDEPAAGFHFGAFTCEGCKSFFGRTYNNPTNVTACKNGGNCVINKRNRTACKACRLKKCLDVGMSKSSSRYGRRSNWFKITYFSEQMRRCNRGASEAMSSLRSASIAAPFRLSYPQGEGSSNELDGGASTSQENLGIQYPYHTSLSPAMLPRSDGSPHPDDMALYQQLCLRNWYLDPPQLSSVTTPPPPREVSSSPLDSRSPRQQSPSTETSAIFAQGTSYSSDSYRSPMPVESRNARNADGSESESNDEDRLHDVQSRSSSSRSPFTPTRGSEQELSKPKVSINGMLMLTEHQHPLVLPGIPFPSGVSPSLPSPWRYNSVFLVNSSPNPDEPIDLSMRTSGGPPRSSESSGKEEKEEEEQEKNDNSPTEETAAYPLDLTCSTSTSAELTA